MVVPLAEDFLLAYSQTATLASSKSLKVFPKSFFAPGGVDLDAPASTPEVFIVRFYHLQREAAEAPPGLFLSCPLPP